MKYLFLYSCYLFLFMLAHTGLGQAEFQRTFGGKNNENAYRILQTSDKGFITVGSTESFGAGKSDIYVVKMDSLGNMEWAKAYGGKGDDFGHYMDRTKDGNIILLGHSSSFDKEFMDICLIKIDEKGNVLWSKSYGLDRSDYSNSIYVTKDGGFIITGEVINFLNHEKNADILVIRTDAEGKILWSRVYGGNNTDYAYSVFETKDGGFMIGGETNSYGSGEWDFYLLKIKKDGTIDWSKTYGSDKTDYGRSAIETPDGGFLIGGNTFSFKSVESDICIIKTNKHGTIEWARVYGGNGTDYLLYLKMLDNDRFVAVGYTNSFELMAEDAFAMTMGLSDKGKVHSAKAFGAELNDYGVSVETTSDGSLVVCGSTNSFGAIGEDIYVFKTTPKNRIEECNMQAMYPMDVRKIEEIKTGTGHYEIELHCNEIPVEMIVTPTITAEQVLCTE